ncbi:CCA tRNA nucleotidyltransferase [Salibaculum griseiflavum]|uniref:CCA tRNA nucleotidyltransferase n=1 Tax=Salibaculum griseiflavum TaxID=1914409 RepID=A0A2V1P6M4_9RHOB|nr:CCA tRNA nucleotidyltransferase [Salibaculum griseiflavum]PWG17037.1 CCA tRNA nucleotidyltransferase [Salibaculum griseiflavum]
MTVLKAAWLNDPGAQAVCRMLEDAGHSAFFVGGCVRNALIGAEVSDLDLSTDARPERIMALAEREGFKAVPTGLEHGTVTIVIDGQPFEITTFRRDVATDGRRATVAFADTIDADAHRRDFTMNALYADPRGIIHDPLDGLPDLRAGHVRFIDDPGQRIREDYLRILRFFRFHAWFGDEAAGLDAEGLAACAAHAEGLESLSKERIGHEMLRLLAAPDPAPSISAMAQSGILARVLAGADAMILPVLVHLENEVGLTPDRILRLAAIGGEGVGDALRLRKVDARRRERLRDAALGDWSTAELGYRLGREDGAKALVLRQAAIGQPVDESLLIQLETGSEQVFPIKAADLQPGVQGPALGDALRRLERDWIDSGFRLTRDALLKKV